MTFRKSAGALTRPEKQLVKALLAKRWRNQDIQALINTGRKATINSARITEVKQNDRIRPAPDDVVEFYKIKKQAFDSKTGLNFYDDERLIRAREAMLLAVQIFNSPNLNFKTEVFAVLANIAWTYLMHEHYARKPVEIIDDDGRTLLLSQMIERQDCPLSAGIKENLKAIKLIRDDVEHTLLGKGDLKWLSLFQACCLNFEKSLCDLFGKELSLQKDLSVALQFAKLTMDQAATLQRYQVPEHIEALDARIRADLSEERLADLEYEFRVIYTLVSSSKSRSHMEFFHPESEEAKQIRNILVKHKLADELYPHKPGEVVRLVAQRAGKAFNSRNHTQAWRKFKVRPRTGVRQPENTNKDFCIYHAAHKDYTYSGQWVDFIAEKIATAEGYDAIRSYRL